MCRLRFENHFSQVKLLITIFQCLHFGSLLRISLSLAAVFGNLLRFPNVTGQPHRAWKHDAKSWAWLFDLALHFFFHFQHFFSVPGVTEPRVLLFLWNRSRFMEPINPPQRGAAKRLQWAKRAIDLLKNDLSRDTPLPLGRSRTEWDPMISRPFHTNACRLLLSSSQGYTGSQSTVICVGKYPGGKSGQQVL